ncbi:hypothetical protein HN51_003201 [Arachis hypogaea]|uniref:J domain-containing protein n=1 Tax=Arachis hypogaea TaxID=3818 RepID=A0A445EJL3_ARAHY|nr:DNAJ protein JJJ1 homolog [Arachis hypogaea]QHO51545.1 uncharacterized protein DS421_1g31780 [Arachis hypogaea]RYR75638.1 hypothetical protein Ahy_A01g000210 [Arachis hypogaea]
MASSSTSAKRCHYEVLGLPRDSTPEEIRSAYRRLALQRHPDKLVQSGISQSEATAQFQELQHAYEVLSDPKERSWYDSHRSQILFSDPDTLRNSSVPDLFSFFSNTVFSGYSDSGRGFYKVYSDVFDKIHANEINFVKKLGLGVDSIRQAPVMGNLDSPYEQVTAFYGYWLGFSTVMDFCWVDEYDVSAGPNRRSRRLMEEENNKVRKKARREYNDTVRRLAEFVKKRDKRVIDMKMKKEKEELKRKEEQKEKKKRLEKERRERAMAYEEPEWAKVDEGEDGEDDLWFEEAEEEGKKGGEKEFYCVLCGKKFKSEKQWKNHEQSKKHKEKVAEFRDSIEDEDEEVAMEDLESEIEVEGREGKEGLESEEDADHVVEDLEERIRDSLNVAEESTRNGVEPDDDDEEEFYDASHEKEGNVVSVSLDGGDDDDEIGALEAMIAGHKSRKPHASTRKPNAPVPPTQIENEDDGVGPMEYENRKGARKKRGSKKEKGRKNPEESCTAGVNGDEEHNNNNDDGNGNSHAEESSFQFNVENVINGKEDEHDGRDKTSNKPADKRGDAKDTKSKAKTSSKGRKAKGASKNHGNTCETCGEEFESRNKLHKHLGDSGHAKIKGR